ncbi:MAG TPA: hypothetical protein VJ376_14720 [Pseudomonadota bacterium]|nr:hypothetical protein [Pseudomonadota bacterium]
MRHRSSLGFVIAAAAMLSPARGGHELPIYPSFYPHEIEIRTFDPERAESALRAAEIQAYLGSGVTFAQPPQENIRAIESLGSIVLVRINPARNLDEAFACAAVKAVAHELAGQPAFILHPYPVTPFQGDYLHHADLAAAAQARFSEGTAPSWPPKIKASGELARQHPDWSAREDDWDAEIIEADAAEEMAAAAFSVNGRLGPPWLRTGWFNAERLLADNVEDGASRERADAVLSRLMTGDFTSLAERINLERELVTLLTSHCQKAVVGYTVKREYVNVEFSAGIENIGYDAIAGLASPMFIRTVKLKDFPWNGWLVLGIGDRPSSAWNPVAGMTDPFGRLMGFAVTDPALMPAPYDAGWMLNRISDLPSSVGR